MAELRCGRRKQANPRKKNVEEEGEAGESVTSDNKLTEGIEDDDSNHDSSMDIDGALSEDAQGSSEVTEEMQQESGSELGTEAIQNGFHDNEEVGDLDNCGDQSSFVATLNGDKSSIATDPEGSTEASRGNDQSAGTTGNSSMTDAGPDYGDEYMLRCNFCSKGFQRVQQLREHSTEVHGEDISPYQCNKCGASYAVRSQLEKHMAFHSPTSQVCTVCHKTFANVYRLQRHMISHNESSDLRKFKCLECGKAFKFKHHLKEHIRIHSGEKPFSCPNCGKRFSHSGSYSSHMTSKKCWVINMKGGRPGQAPPEESPRRLAPKVDQNGLDLSVPNAYANAYQAAMTQAYMAFDPTSQRLPTPYLAHMNGMGPFMSYGPYARHPIVNPALMSPYAFPPSGSKPPDTRNLENLEVLSKVAAQQAQLLDKSVNSKSPSPDENQNLKSRSDQCSAIDLQKKSEAESLEGDDDTKTNEAVVDNEEAATPDMASDTASDNKTNFVDSDTKDDLSSVKRILQVVEATVKQQQQNQTDKVNLSKLVKLSLREGACGNPMSLANRARQVLQDHIKTTQSDKPGSPGKQDTQDLASGMKKFYGNCKYCSTSFFNGIELHQHERYRCSYNTDIPKIRVPVPPIRNIVKTNSDEAASSPRDGVTSCRYCQQSFESLVDLHQHERYLCRENKEVLQGQSEAQEHASGVDGDLHEDDHRSGLEQQRIRSRSVINEEQLRVLRAHYQQNPRPSRDDLQLLAKQIGFPKKVVQVWFQNRRAQDKKRVGRMQASYSDGIPSPALAWERSNKTGTAYIPVVPQFQPTSSVATPNLAVYPSTSGTQTSDRPNGQFNATMASPQPATSVPDSMQLEPLDLSTKKQPQEAHTNKPFSQGLTEGSANGVLNLSKKKEESDIPKDEPLNLNCSGAPHESLLRPEAPERGYRSSCSTPQLRPASAGEPSFRMSPVARPHSAHSTPEQSLHINPKATSTPAHLPSPGSYLPPGSPSQSNLASPHSSLESSFNSTLSLDSTGLDQDGTARSKRARKKSWRQVGGDMEADEMQMEFGDDSLTIEEDYHHRKKRKSWKQHKLETEEGMYACDQCDKVFSKQSSLARHKYEHSGQRPFECDICHKAFKHKHHLTEHKRLHSGDKPFQCKKCGKRFSHSGSYSQHMNHRYKYCKPLRMGEVEDF